MSAMQVHQRLAVWAVAFAVLVPGLACGQYQPKSYSDYYSKSLQNYRRPPVSPQQYTIDRYYYHNPAVSPYSNLMRPSWQYTNNYFRYVRPEQQRREAQMIKQNSPRPPTTGGGVSGSMSVSPYHNHWYGGRSAMGLR